MKPSISTLLDSPGGVAVQAPGALGAGGSGDCVADEVRNHQKTAGQLRALGEDIADIRGRIADAYAEGMADQCNMQ